MLLVYIDDILAMSEAVEDLVGIIGSKFKLKKSSVGRIARYLGGGIEHIQTDNGRIIWSTNCVEYIKSVIDIVRKIWLPMQSLCIRGVMASALSLPPIDLS